ncbi:uncharacterized protein MELLADRAFT_77161 [Melampsora larici-populina 98AG31]|uniref:Uncharacterized protein n=1 Tax=Melampsora larici-populina (strain 98AG31 / pathotype 3-4-7) TaxID=747676 RepID=F4RE43_MELLP|nr:uncharacterized protein MELLADRAFT_77161 [Melampsora larici-populina 98AG31]EGG09338.1 hypothetical protein MELLADRAFT_77161 [Melampsora larici-populina 98AG31]
MPIPHFITTQIHPSSPQTLRLTNILSDQPDHITLPPSLLRTNSPYVPEKERSSSWQTPTTSTSVHILIPTSAPSVFTPSPQTQSHWHWERGQVITRKSYSQFLQTPAQIYKPSASTLKSLRTLEVFILSKSHPRNQILLPKLKFTLNIPLF